MNDRAVFDTCKNPFMSDFGSSREVVRKSREVVSEKVLSILGQVYH